MLDIVICAIPQMSPGNIPAAPALLKSAITDLGYSAKTLDLSIDFFIEQCDRNLEKFSEFCSVFRSVEKPTAESQLTMTDWLESSINKLKKLDPLIIGISVFSHYQHRAAYILASEIRKQLPDKKIVLGGYGLSQSCNSLNNFIDIKKIETLKPFHQYVSEQKLCDYVVLDDPLNKIITIIDEVTSRNSGDQIKYPEGKAVYNTPIPNYDDYSFNSYFFKDNILAAPITGSKGCVRSCTFCDVPDRFGKFKFRTGKDIADEMIYLAEKYQIRVFEFTDSLVNGANKAFIEWLTIIADYNDTQSPENKIHWLGQYICKPQASVPEYLYSLMFRSGVINLLVGVESGSNDVLAAMKKQITVADVYDELKMFQKHNISVSILMLSGFYNETWERYLETLDFLIKCQPYILDSTIWSINVSFPLLIYDGVELSDAAHQLGIMLDPYNYENWTVDNDPSNDFPERCRRRIITQLVLDKLGVGTSYINMDFLT